MKNLKYLLPIFSVVFSFASLSAQIELIAELNPGSDGTDVGRGQFNTLPVVQLSDAFLFAAQSEQFGRELYKIENGEINILKDIMPGSEGSSCRYFTEYKGLVYFLAGLGEDMEVWSTDGTEAGTVKAFDIPVVNGVYAEASEFLVSESNIMYFNFDNGLYRFDGANLSQIEHSTEINITEFWNGDSRPWCKYKEGIAFFNPELEETNLYYVADDQIEIIGSIPRPGSFSDIYAMCSTENGIFYSISVFDPDVEGHYFWNESDASITKVSSVGAFSRSTSLNPSLCLVNIADEGVLKFDGSTNGSKIVETASRPPSGFGWNKTNLDGGLLFIGSDGFFDNDLYYYNDETDKVNLVLTTNNYSSLRTINNVAYFFAATVDGAFDEFSLYSFRKGNEAPEILFTGTQPRSVSSLKILGIQDNKLYFNGDFEFEIGNEFYSLQLEPSNTHTFENKNQLQVLQTGQNTYQVTSLINNEIHIDIFSVDGRKLAEYNTLPSQTFEVPYSGILLFRLNQGGKNHTVKVGR